MFKNEILGETKLKASWGNKVIAKQTGTGEWKKGEEVIKAKGGH
jgi:hypothetical protein